MNALDCIRTHCLTLPEVTEKLSHGEPTWFVRGRSFAMFANRHHDDRVAVWCAAPEGLQEALMQSAPDRYFRPPYVGVRAWIGVYLDVPLDWSEVEDILTEAHRTIISKRPAPRKAR